MGDIVTSGSERNRPQVPYGLGGISSPWGGGGSGYGGRGFGSGFGWRSRLGAARFPGADPMLPPPGLENLTQMQGGYDPEAFWNVRGKGNTALNGGFYGGGENTYDAQGRKTGVSKPKWQEGVPGYQPNTMERYKALSSAAGWAGNPMQRNMGISQGAGFGSPDDALRRLLAARMGGGF